MTLEIYPVYQRHQY